MTPANPPLLWIATSIKRKASIRLAHAFDAHSVVGLPAKTTTGPAAADMSGIRSIREACAPLACISGLKPSAYLVVDGRRTLIGMQSERAIPLIYLFKALACG